MIRIFCNFILLKLLLSYRLRKLYNTLCVIDRFYPLLSTKDNMQTLFEPPPKAFNLLSIGQRGVGKTVYLAGSYSQLQNAPLDLALQSTSKGVKSYQAVLSQNLSIKPSQLWFECQDEKLQAKLESILNYVKKTGSYPPPTIKITNFDFRLKHPVKSTIKTLCNFQWWDIPGEACDLRNEEFQEIILSSHGCCVFISAEALVQEQDYVESLKDIFNQVLAIAVIMREHKLNYPFAFILTKCDLLEPESIVQAQIERCLQPFIMRLDHKNVNYKWFQSAIPIASTNGTPMLDAKGSADSLLWLLSELNQYYQFHSERDLATVLTEKPKPLLSLPRWAVILIVISVSFLAIGSALWLGLRLGERPPTPEQQSQ